ncbi:MAG: serine hydrolase domain-containing protein [Actinomycetota bacterium]|jgi:CubicO group peptidase (beta-lactamase class C family)
MSDLIAEIDRIAIDSRFSGAVRVDRHGDLLAEAAYGWADRAHLVANSVDTRFGIASGAKGFTALTVMRAVETGALELATTARSLLGPDLPLIDAAVTVEHLLAHRSGIGDYLDEEVAGDIRDHLMPVPVHELASTESYLRVLDGHHHKFAPGTAFAYCNGGYVLLALLLERATGTAFHDLVQRSVCDPAALRCTAYLRSDELPGDAAIGYLEVDGLRSNVLHLPVLGSGDGGIFSTVGDVSSLWTALFEGRLVSAATVAAVVQTRSTALDSASRYGLGFWLHATTGAVMLEGYDAGVSFRSVHSPSSGLTHTVMSNTSEGAWPITRRLDEVLTLDM